MRITYVSAAVLVGLLLSPASPADAIVTLCGQGFPCNPQTMHCSTAWVACHFDGGVFPCVPHPECSADPSSCFEAAYNETAQAPGLPSNWGISPAPGALPCTLPMMPLAALKLTGQTAQWLQHLVEVRALVLRYMGDLKILQPNDAWYKGRLKAYIHILAGLNTIARAMVDPANPNYQFIPGLSVTPPPTLVTDASLTPAQAAALIAWMVEVRAVADALTQYNDTFDNLAGAVLDYQAGHQATATPWICGLAQAGDAAMATAAAAGAREVARRAGLSVGPVRSMAAYCPVAADQGQAILDSVVDGASLYEAALAGQQVLVGGTCAPAAVWPTALIAASATDAARYASWAPLGLTVAAETQLGITCAAAALTSTPSSLVFGSVIVGNKSGNQTVTIRNTSAANAVIGTVTRTGADVALFLKAAPNDLCSGRTLTPNQTCTIGIKFAPVSLGAKSASLVIPSNQPTLTIPLTGTGILATGRDINVTPLALAYGSVPVGGSSALMSVTVQNVGNATLIIGTVTRSGVDVGLFVKAAQNDLCSGATLAPLATCTVGLKFKPTSSGPKSATLLIPSNDPDEAVVSVPMTGTGL